MAARQVVISGAAGNAATTAAVNGRYEQVDREVYHKVGRSGDREVGEAGRWLFVTKDGNWMVGSTAGRDARKTEPTGWAHSVASAGGMPPPAGMGRWQVCDSSDDDDKWVDDKWVEQTVVIEVLDAGQARGWVARQAEQVGA